MKTLCESILSPDFNGSDLGLVALLDLYTKSGTYVNNGVGFEIVTKPDSSAMELISRAIDNVSKPIPRTKVASLLKAGQSVVIGFRDKYEPDCVGLEIVSRKIPNSPSNINSTPDLRITMYAYAPRRIIVRTDWCRDSELARNNVENCWQIPNSEYADLLEYIKNNDTAKNPRGDVRSIMDSVINAVRRR